MCLAQNGYPFEQVCKLSFFDRFWKVCKVKSAKSSLQRIWSSRQCQVCKFFEVCRLTFQSLPTNMQKFADLPCRIILFTKTSLQSQVCKVKSAKSSLQTFVKQVYKVKSTNFGKVSRQTYKRVCRLVRKGNRFELNTCRQEIRKCLPTNINQSLQTYQNVCRLTLVKVCRLAKKVCRLTPTWLCRLDFADLTLQTWLCRLDFADLTLQAWLCRLDFADLT